LPGHPEAMKMSRRQGYFQSSGIGRWEGSATSGEEPRQYSATEGGQRRRFDVPMAISNRFR
jgi:hypothetical protein